MERLPLTQGLAARSSICPLGSCLRLPLWSGARLEEGKREERQQQWRRPSFGPRGGRVFHTAGALRLYPEPCSSIQQQPQRATPPLPRSPLRPEQRTPCRLLSPSNRPWPSSFLDRRRGLSTRDWEASRSSFGATCCAPFNPLAAAAQRRPWSGVSKRDPRQLNQYPGHGAGRGGGVPLILL